jgi:hypothetical protein
MISVTVTVVTLPCIAERLSELRRLSLGDGHTGRNIESKYECIR